MRTFRRYTLIQLPGWICAGLIVYALWAWFGVPGWIAAGIFALFVAKDFALYPVLKRSYEDGGNLPVLELAGKRGQAVEDVMPRGYVRVDGELWMAEAAPESEPVPAGAPVRVQAVRGNVLIVSREAERTAPV
ncbi:MAG: NfeD family protein [bacterium]